MELHEIESAIIQAEADLVIAKTNHDSLKNKRDGLKDGIKEIKDAAATEIYEIQKHMQEEMDRIREEALLKTKEAEEEYHRLSSDQWDAQRAAAKAKQRLDDLEAMRDIARRANIKAAEFSTLENRWDLLTMGAPWREWAKDHQISGAKKMTYEGRMILGDTMGLGKTLTSLIAIDMIEAATKDASVENPVNFGSMD